MNADTVNIQSIVDELFRELIEAHGEHKQSYATLCTHLRLRYPEAKSAYTSISEYRCDVRAQEDYSDRHRLLQHIYEQARKWENIIVARLAEYLPWNTWFKFGPFAIALASQYEDEPDPFAAIEEWSSELPDLRNDDQFIRYVASKQRHD